MKRLSLIILLALVPLVAAYPQVVITSAADSYVATGAPSTSGYFAPNLPHTYDYVDGYQAGYATATQDVFTTQYSDPYTYPYPGNSYIYTKPVRDSRDTVVINNGYPTYTSNPTFSYDYNNFNANVYGYNTYDATPGRSCDFGQRNICLYNYAPCSRGYCQTGNPDRSVYTYYNPMRFPGYYPMTDRNGIYIIN